MKLKIFQKESIAEYLRHVSDLEDKIMEITTAEQDKEKRMKINEDTPRVLWDNIKHNNIRMIGVPEGEERERTREYI